MLFSCSVMFNSLGPMDWSTPGFPVLHHVPELLKFLSIELAMPSNHLILCRPLLLLPPIFPSIRVFSNESALQIRWPNYWSFNSASVLPMNSQGWFPLGLTGLISLLSKTLSRVLSSTTVQKNQFFSTQLSLWSNCHFHRASLVAQTVKCLPAMWETWVWSLVREDPSEKEMATHSSTLAWEIPWVEEPGGLQSTGSQRIRHD